jgi:hypothetical protein
MAMRDDSELPDDSEDAEWLVGHLVACRDCRTRLDAMQDARLTYSAWDPAAPPAWVFSETMAAAAALPSDAAPPVKDKAVAAAAAAPPAAAAPAGGAEVGAPLAGGHGWPEVPAALVSAGERLRRRRRELLLSGAWGVVLIVGAIALFDGGVFGTAEGDDKPPDDALRPPAETRVPAEPARPARRVPARKRDTGPERPAQPHPAAQRPVTPAPVVVAPPPVAQQRTPPQRRQRARPRREEPRADPPATVPTPRQPAAESPPSEGTPPAQPITPVPAPQVCTNPGGQPVPC